MTIFESVILGIVEGISEFLPISSTGHLILVSGLLGIPDSAFLSSFEIAIQLGAICSVVFLYWKMFLNIEVMKRIAAAFVPTAAIGFAFYSFVKTYLLGNEMVVIVALLLGGIALIVFELVHREDSETPEGIVTMSYAQSALIGVFQSIAIIPGVSRSAASIVGGLLIGIRRTTIVEFSFLLAVPTMLAATTLDIVKTSSVFSRDDIIALAVGFVTAFIVAVFAIKFLLSYVRTHSFIAFGIYRIAVAMLFFLIVI